ncbi:10 kDa chaperonin [Candidatus Neptunochlamydia vexilliferae]|uniref:Co-chaperonin GroES n=2 Tax=Candidatus Neptunichlamydia vexilliferae TaxID=1651774 RepID=A0ABS0B0S0_9BACT|nr:10 kDa chaperonin [Candidatus Neptunochlamydia vexilliferae]
MLNLFDKNHCGPYDGDKKTTQWEKVTMSEKKFKPLGNRVLVKRSEAVESKGGILLPDSAQEKQKQGEVLAVGPGKMKEGKLEEMELKVGDKILFSAFAGTEVKGEEELLIMSEDDVLAVVE